MRPDPWQGERSWRKRAHREMKLTRHVLYEKILDVVVMQQEPGSLFSRKPDLTRKARACSYALGFSTFGADARVSACVRHPHASLLQICFAGVATLSTHDPTRASRSCLEFQDTPHSISSHLGGRGCAGWRIAFEINFDGSRASQYMLHSCA